MSDNMNCQTDPVLSTEILGLQWLCAASIPEAVEFNKVLCFNSSEKRRNTPGYTHSLKSI